jgi:hypothetical protein
MKHLTSLMAAALGLLGAAAWAQDRAVIDPTVILGNRELPKVLYIVPWKKPVPGDMTGRPLVSVVDEALAPLDPDVFRRQVQYQAQQQAVVQAKAQARQQAQALQEQQAKQAKQTEQAQQAVPVALPVPPVPSLAPAPAEPATPSSP